MHSGIVISAKTQLLEILSDKKLGICTLLHVYDAKKILSIGKEALMALECK